VGVFVGTMHSATTSPTSSDATVRHPRKAMQEMEEIVKSQHQGNAFSLLRPRHCSASSNTSSTSSDAPEEPTGGAPDGTCAAGLDWRVRWGVGSPTRGRPEPKTKHGASFICFTGLARSRRKHEPKSLDLRIPCFEIHEWRRPGRPANKAICSPAAGIFFPRFDSMYYYL
jgi:hypothetical protein